MAKVRGIKGVQVRLQRLTGPEMVRQVGAALYAGGQIIEADAGISITTGSVSGKGHVPSKPGEPPNNDTGVLARNIETVLVAPLRAEVSSNAPYARDLEFGTSKMGERPYMRPAAAKNRKAVTKLIRDAIDKVVAGGKVT